MIILNIITFPNSHITPLPILSSSNFSSCDYFYYRSRAKRSRELLIRDVLSSHILYDSLSWVSPLKLIYRHGSRKAIIFVAAVTVKRSFDLCTHVSRSSIVSLEGWLTTFGTTERCTTRTTPRQLSISINF